jgi:hypothetical protein
MRVVEQPVRVPFGFAQSFLSMRGAWVWAERSTSREQLLQVGGSFGLDLIR